MRETRMIIIISKAKSIPSSETVTFMQVFSSEAGEGKEWNYNLGYLEVTDE